MDEANRKVNNFFFWFAFGGLFASCIVQSFGPLFCFYAVVEIVTGSVFILNYLNDDERK